MSSALLALVCANTPLQSAYELLLSIPVVISIGALEVAKPLLLWINDGLMAIFFFLIGLELKRELIEGELSDKRNIILPGIGAVGGMLVPAVIYVYFNSHDPIAMQGWAIPAATDIAFALGVLALLGSRVPISIKIFLTSLAIFDDIGAIVIIAIFYTAEISFAAMIVVACSILALMCLNKRNVIHSSPYILVGTIMWVATLKSGVHATLAGVVLAMFIPIRSKTDPDISPLKIMEHDLHPIVAFFVLPVFAFANAGISLKLTALPRGISWLTLYGVSALCGIGFTMSLFVSSLAFEQTGVNLLFDERLGIILGSLTSGILGYFILAYSLRGSRKLEQPTT